MYRVLEGVFVHGGDNACIMHDRYQVHSQYSSHTSRLSFRYGVILIIRGLLGWDSVKVLMFRLGMNTEDSIINPK